jgi:hypothetical protein
MFDLVIGKPCSPNKEAISSLSLLKKRSAEVVLGVPSCTSSITWLPKD